MVVDTMIFAYALLGVPRFRDEALSVLTNAGEILVPDFFRAELVNVVWQWTRENAIPLSIGLGVLTDADALITQAISTEQLWERALELSVEANHPAYDTLFVALAEASQEISRPHDLTHSVPRLGNGPAPLESSGS